MITMLLGGVWHGAGWTFIIWGVYHGVLLSLHHASRTYWDRLPILLRWVLTFLLVVVGWIFFRAATLPMALSIIHRMFVPTPGLNVPQPLLGLFPLMIAAVWAIVGPNVREISHVWRPAWVFWLAIAFGACLALIMGERTSPFLYFQF
jgi:D-alanyl-lipoteichoic acid acyltransferase DltB (MBOAT superfamily)